ncbi:PLP-dependent aminotransferase family protein [Micrococcus sp.]|uniref:aminotransferase-like domain-containing protein n=1 Tax=Micrococcus sp. TaxID=1271 RepID=UPI002A90CB8D|nr:PLP-dependent aminotransferase family protein [Micrococcus sp.]MDY6054625.1 PLP-dependent aminotransferase family protein [Micrococcus sp.]
MSAPTRSHLSDRAAGVRQSAVRDVFDIAMDPSLVSLAGGNPWLSGLPLEELGAAAARLVAQEGTTSLQYGPGQGTERMRQAACTVMAADGLPGADPDLVVVTPGSQAAIDTACRAFANPGDVVVVEDPTFVGALTSFTTWQLDAVATPTDEHGLVPAALDATLTRLRSEGRRVAFLYTIPSFANPSGLLLPEDRRDEVAEMCARHDVLIVEDNPYGQIAFDGAPLAPIAARHRERTVYLGTMSKIFSPGVRVGWALVPAALKREFYLCAESAFIHASTTSQMLATAFVEEFDWQGHVREVTGLYRARARALQTAVDEHWRPGFEYTAPRGGFFLWGRLPPGVDTVELMRAGIEAGAVFVPGAAFTPVEGMHSTLRLAYSFVDEDTLVEGVRRLAPVVQAAVESAERRRPTPSPLSRKAP